jgi:hypothetical protein
MLMLACVLQCRMGKLTLPITPLGRSNAVRLRERGSSERVADSLHLCCPAEANYAHQQELDMIPLMMQKGYSPKGWLGLILGTRMWYAVHSALSFHCCDSTLFFSD